MCIAIYKPAGKVIPQEQLRRCHHHNGDGAGFVYREDKKLHLEKGLWTFDEFWEKWNKHQEKQALIHFRIRTHGDISQENCHPFMIGDHLAFAHNGTFNKFMPQNEEKISDTVVFSNTVLKPLWDMKKTFWKNPLLGAMLEDYIGFNKLVFLHSSGEWEVYNASSWWKEDDVWFSTKAYDRPIPTETKRYTPTTATGSRAHGNGSRSSVAVDRRRASDSSLFATKSVIWNENWEDFYTMDLFEYVKEVRTQVESKEDNWITTEMMPAGDKVAEIWEREDNSLYKIYRSVVLGE